MRGKTTFMFQTERLPVDFEASPAFAILHSFFTSDPPKRTEFDMTVWDTFSWSLLSSKSALTTEGTTARFISENGMNSYTGKITLPTHGFIQPEMKNLIPLLREILLRLTKGRALLERLRVAGIKHEFLLRNDETKIVAIARFASETSRILPVIPGGQIAGVPDTQSDVPGAPTPGKTLQYLEIESLRGFESETEPLRTALLAVGLAATDKSPLECHASLHGTGPEYITTSISPPLIPDTPVKNAALASLIKLSEIANLNEQWVTKGIDPEFCHDYRVALRKMRALLSLLKKYLPAMPEECGKFLAETQKMTNLLRDLELFIIEEPKYLQQLPVQLRGSAACFFKKLRNDFRSEQKAVEKRIASDWYKDGMSQWKAAINSYDSQNADNPSPSVAESVGRIFAKLYGKTTAEIHTASESDDDTVVHRLRIRFKKLRYAFEFFQPNFPSNLATIVGKQLKRIQDCIGAYTDLSFRCAYCAEMINDMADNFRREPKSSLAAFCGGLLTLLFSEKKKVLDEIHEETKKFASVKVKRIYEELTRKKDGGEL